MALDTALTLTELLNPPSLNSLLTNILSRLGKAGFSPTDWESDSDSRILLQTEAQTLEDLWQAILQIAKGGYLDTATFSWLDLLALSQYQLVRNPAVQTIGNFTLSTINGAGPYTFNAGDLVTSTIGTDGITTVVFRSTNPAPVTVNVGPATTTIQVSADVPGSNANIASGSTFIVTTPRPGLDVSNPGVNQPAMFQTGITSGPFPLTGKSLIISVSIAGGPTITDTLTFPASYANLALVSTAVNNLIALSTLAGILTTSVVGETLLFQTIHAGSPTSPDFISISNLGTANLLLAISTSQTSQASGTFNWITQYGQDAESDDSLITRCKVRWGILGAGTRDAFISWATSADPQIQKVVVYSNYFDGTPKSGAVTLYIAPAIGIFSIPATHISAVYNYILPRLPIMSQLFVGACGPKIQDVAGDLYIKPGFDPILVSQQAANNASSYILSLNIGQDLIFDKLVAAIVDTPGVYDLVLTNPISNVTNNKNTIFIAPTVSFRNLSV